MVGVGNQDTSRAVEISLMISVEIWDVSAVIHGNRIEAFDISIDVYGTVWPTNEFNVKMSSLVFNPLLCRGERVSNHTLNIIRRSRRNSNCNMGLGHFGNNVRGNTTIHE